MQNEDENFCTLYLVRHGQTEWNVKHVVMGHGDSPLTEEGKRQAKDTAEELKSINFDAIFSSDSARAHKTAEIIKLERKLLVQTSRLLRERSFGRFEGKPALEYKKEVKNLLAEREHLSEEEKWKYKFGENVESDFELVSRFIIKLREISSAYAGKTVLVVSHGGCLRTFLMRLGVFKYGELPGGSFGNAGYIKVLCDGVDFFVKEIKGVSAPKGTE